MSKGDWIVSTNGTKASVRRPYMPQEKIDDRGLDRKHRNASASVRVWHVVSTEGIALRVTENSLRKRWSRCK